MSFAAPTRGALLAALVATLPVASTYAQEGAQAAPPRAQRARTVRVVGTIRDEQNAIALPGIPVEVIRTGQVVYTDVDGRYVIEIPPGSHQIKVAMEGYQEKTITVDATAPSERTITADVGLTMARYAETVTVTGELINAQTASAEAQLIERKQSQVIRQHGRAGDEVERR